MKRALRILPVVLFGLGIFSCHKAPQPLTKAQIKFKVDSITRVRMQESDEHARIDLDRRMKIEVKVKVDSILNARMPPPAKDTAHPVLAARPPMPMPMPIPPQHN